MGEHKIEIAESFLKFGRSLKPFNRYSQNGEDGILEGIFERIGTSNKWCVEVGAYDGLLFSNTRHLIEQGWRSLQIECEPERYQRLHERYNGNSDGRVLTLECQIEPSGRNSLDSIMGEIPEIPHDLDLLVIDIDGQDFYIWNGVLNYRPRVVMCEFNPHSNPEFIPDLGGPGQAGMVALQRLAVGHGYAAIIATAYNLICIRLDVVQQALGSLPIAETQQVAMQPDRQELSVNKDDEVGRYIYVKDPETGNQARVKAAALISMGRWGMNATWGVIQNTFGGRGLDLNTLKMQGGIWGQQMQRGLNKLIDEGCNWVFALDHDSIFTLEDAQEMLRLAVKYPDAAAIVPWQVKRGGWNGATGNGPAIVGVRGQDGKLAKEYPTGYFSTELVPITMGHFGFTLIKLDAIKDVPKPWLLSVPNPENGEWDGGKCDDDVYFWCKLVDHGLKVYLANNIRVGHIDETVLWMDRNFKVVNQSVADYFTSGKPTL